MTAVELLIVLVPQKPKSTVADRSFAIGTLAEVGLCTRTPPKL